MCSLANVRALCACFLPIHLFVKRNSFGLQSATASHFLRVQRSQFNRIFLLASPRNNDESLDKPITLNYFFRTGNINIENLDSSFAVPYIHFICSRLAIQALRVNLEPEILQVQLIFQAAQETHFHAVSARVPCVPDCGAPSE